MHITGFIRPAWQSG